MKHLHTFNENHASLHGILEIRTNMPDADFYIIRKGSDSSVGTPTKPGDPKLDAEKFGVKCNRDVLLPDYLFYMVQYLHQSRAFQQFAHGTLSLKTLRKEDVQFVITQGLMKNAG